MNESDKGLGDTSMFRVSTILTDDGEFAIASGYWNKETELSIACRWHAQGKSCGYPQTFGKPQWMLLPAKYHYLAKPSGDKIKESAALVLEF